MLTEQQIVERRSRVGASDVAAIMGVPTFAGRNALTVYWEKIGALEENPETDAMEAGNRLEPYILDWAERELGPLERNVVVFDPTGAPIASTLDGRVVASGVPVEVKTSGIFGPIHGEWGEAGTDEVPDGYIVQCQTQLLCTEAEVCRLFALLGTRGRVEFTIRREPRLIATIRDVASDFYAEFVARRRDPRDGWAERLETTHGIRLTADPCAPVLDAARRLKRVSGKVVRVDNADPFLMWDKLRAVRLDAEKAEKSKLAECLSLLGDADAAELPGGVVFAYAEQRTADIVVREAMKRDGVYERYARANTARVPRLKGGEKKGNKKGA